MTTHASKRPGRLHRRAEATAGTSASCAARAKLQHAEHRRFHALAVKEAMGKTTAAETVELDRLNRQRNPLPFMYAAWMKERDKLCDAVMDLAPAMLMYAWGSPKTFHAKVLKFRRDVAAYKNFLAVGFDAWAKARRERKAKAA